VVNWDTPDLTLRCVAALLDAGVPAGRVVLVDNGSTDRSFERFEEEVSACVLLRLETNRGYSYAANLGARALEGSAYLFVNNDAFVHAPGSVGSLVGLLQNPRVGVAVPRVLNEDLSLQPSVHSLPTPAVALVRALGVSRFLPNRWQPEWGTRWRHDARREIDAAAGAVLLIRGELWQSLRGGFAEYTEHFAMELDLFLRARKLGWESWFEPAAEFIHIGRGSTRDCWATERRAWMVGKSERQVVFRLLPPVSAALSELFTSAGIAVRLPARYLLRQPDEVARLKGGLYGHLGLRKPDQPRSGRSR
jgi:GT2 family glycosyltransferase